MCGIVGIIGKETANKEKIIRDMATSIQHRGPDQDGFFDNEIVSLGMRRLSIIDLSGGKQPITSADGKTLIFFNGEIYNYKELRTELQKKGYVFKTDSDTEVILHTYDAYGKAGLNNLRGMFAFCIYDTVSQILFIARDFFGIKPLYYLKDEKGSGEKGSILGFASEIKALLEHPAIKMPGALRVNDDAVFHYLRFQYDPLEETFFKNVFTLRPGHCMTIDLLAGTHTIEEYWKFAFAKIAQKTKPAEPLVDEKRFQQKTLDTLRDSVAHHMISDVPVGSFLSGGVDSSIIATLMNEVIDKENPGTKNKTFTVGFKELSEGKHARETSDILGTDHTEIIIDKEEYFSVLPKLIWHFDEPVADPSAIALYFVAREARKKVTVVLSGEGADELFGGYNIYLAPIAARRLAWIPQIFLKAAIAVLPDMWGKNYLKRASSRLSEWYIGNASIFSKKEVDTLWKASRPSNTSVPYLDTTYVQAAKENISDSATMQLVDINTWLVGDILAKADKMTMANSLELRVPFLDTKVSDLAETLPDSLKWKTDTQETGGMQTKYILRKAFANIIPETARMRRKLGFPTPLRAWLTTESTSVFETIRNSPVIQAYLHVNEVEKVILAHTSGATDNSRKIYLLYTLALWHQVFFEKDIQK